MRRRLVFCSLLLALAACKSAKVGATLRDDATAGPCRVNPDSKDDNRSVPADADLRGCDDATLTGELRALGDEIALVETRTEVVEKAQDKAEGKPSPDAKAKTTAADATAKPAATPDGGDLAGIALALADTELEARRRELDELKRDIARFQDRAIALERELARRVGRPDEAGICVYARGGYEITSCGAGRTKAGCRAYVRTNSAYFYRFAKCEEFRLGDDWEALNARLEGACVRVGADLRVAACEQRRMSDCFDSENDFSDNAFRAGRACADYRVGASFEGLTPAAAAGASRFETDCRAVTGASFRRNQQNAPVCTCGGTNEHTEALFYQRGAESCRQLARGNPAAPPVAADVRLAFRRSCELAGGRANDDAFADDGMSCACGGTKLSLRTFARDARENLVAGFEDACRRNIRDGATVQMGNASTVVRQPSAHPGTVPAGTRTGQCTCSWDGSGQYCSVFKAGKALAYMGPLVANTYVCGTSRGGADTNDLCSTALASTLAGPLCR